MPAARESIIAALVLGGLLAYVDLSVARAASSVHSIPKKFVSQIDQADSISGLHWIRIADPRHPAAPPHLIRVPRSAGAAEVAPKSSSICVRSGDRVQIQSGDAHTAAISLEATALASGVRGDRIRARVIVTGAIVQMSVSGPAAGTLTSGPEAWR